MSAADENKFPARRAKNGRKTGPKIEELMALSKEQEARGKAFCHALNKHRNAIIRLAEHYGVTSMEALVDALIQNGLKDVAARESTAAAQRLSVVALAGMANHGPEWGMF